MELTAAASWLNTAFAGYDRMILSLLHSVANGFFTFLFKLITLLGEKGILFFLAAIILMCFPKARCMHLRCRMLRGSYHQRHSERCCSQAKAADSTPVFPVVGRN